MGRQFLSSGVCRIAGVLAVASVTCLLGGCTLPLDPPNEAVGNRIADALRPYEDDRRATVDLGHVMPGDWTRAVIVCGGSYTALKSLLGFEPPDYIRLEDADFLSAVVFATDREVESYFQAGLDDLWVDHWYFTFCSRPRDPGSSEVAELQLELPRDSAQLTFSATTSNGYVYWFVEPSTLVALDALAG